MSLKDSLRKLTPNILLEWNRGRKKAKLNAILELKKKEGDHYTKVDLAKDLVKLGVKKGDVVLVHSSLSQMGFLANGPQSIINALKEVVSDTGTILMPTSPNSEWQYDFIRKNPLFDVRSTPSKTGKITESFRKMEGVVRSVHPTEPVAAWGKDAEWFVNEHFGELTPYTEKSPFRKVSERHGKLIYIGVTLDNAGTNLHTLEDAFSDFKFPIYANEVFEVEVIDSAGKSHIVKTKVHNPDFSKKRKCDQLIPMFDKAGALKKGKVGDADTLVFDAYKFFNTMVQAYEKSGVTMYTPQGSK